ATVSTDFPTVNPLQATNSTGDFDVFVAKLNATGTALDYSTLLGGSQDDLGNGIAVDGSGNAYITGVSSSADFPLAHPLQGINGSDPFHDGAAFVAKLDATGTALAYSTYLGGSRENWGNGIAVDGAGNAYVTGFTNSGDFPTLHPLEMARPGLGTLDLSHEAFVTEVNAAGTALVYSTYLGGSTNTTHTDSEEGSAIAGDGAGNAYVTGFTTSPDFPTTAGAFQRATGGVEDAFVTKVNAGGTALGYSTYLGGSGSDVGNSIAVDGAGNTYVTGWTASTDFPTQNPLQANISAGRDAFVTQLNASGTALVYSTFLGGSFGAEGNGIAVDGAGNAYVTGRTGSADFPTQDPVQPALAGPDNAFVTKLNATGTALIYSTFLGGSGHDTGVGIAVDGAGNA